MSRTATILIMAVTALGLFTGCKPTTQEKQALYEMRREAFESRITAYFQKMNNDTAMRQLRLDFEETKGAVPGIDADPLTGQVLQHFDFSLDGLVLLDVKCDACQTKQTAPYHGVRIRCGRCGGMYEPTPLAGEWTAIAEDDQTRETMETLGKNVVPMYRTTEELDAKKPLKAKVIYIRTTVLHDPASKITLSPKALERASVSASELQKEGGYRSGDRYFGMVEFAFEGGALKVVSRAEEEAIRPWKNLRRFLSN